MLQFHEPPCVYQSRTLGRSCEMSQILFCLSQVQLAPARPMDLFKAVFEASDASDSESDAEQHPAPPSQPQPPPPRQPQQQPQPPASTAGTSQPAETAAPVGQNGAAPQQEARAATLEAEPLSGPQSGQSDSAAGALQPEKTSIIQAALKRLRRKEKKKKKRRKEEKAKKRKRTTETDSETGSDADAGSDSDSGSAERHHKKKRHKHKSFKKS